MTDFDRPDWINRLEAIWWLVCGRPAVVCRKVEVPPEIDGFIVRIVVLGLSPEETATCAYEIGEFAVEMEDEEEAREALERLRAGS